MKRKLGIFPIMMGGPENSRKDEHLTFMNISALMARQDAAYDRAVELLSENLFSFNEQRRSEVYEAVMKLLDTAVVLGKSMPRQSEARQKDRDPIAQYFLLLKDTVQAAYALVTHEMILFQEEKQLSDFIGSAISSQFRSTDEIFSNSELSIYHCLRDLIEMAEPAIARNRERAQKSLPKGEIERYRKSFKEFNKLYRDFGPPEETKPQTTTEPQPPN